MKHLKYKSELYNCCAPRLVGPDMYTCDAWKVRTGREIKNVETLDALGKMLIRSNKGYQSKSRS